MKSSLSRVAFLVSPPQSLSIRRSNSCAKLRQKCKTVRVLSQRSGKITALYCSNHSLYQGCQCSLQPVKKPAKKLIDSFGNHR
ncbi:hypothetical protein Desti_1652 [Desulfomonile tiedjei DSM 6799]|uniref:Uncharacterized protein n=1 Tax=Desulfomonile tiedjei (strain ATCC 49306 / DSM 6799 / DCB-1) TaxID=706587 RepID=I4C472_DESTA|nr:hypothetical protein Desti_1652 [Desulfomonile tiedjei DSM 6799]